MPVRAVRLSARYQRPRLIGRGGMAEVYRARDSVLDRDVAVKVLAEAADGDARARFEREALAVARLSGEPHTVPIYDVGEVDGRPFLVMAYMAGGSLAERLERGGPVSTAEALIWLEQAARALDYAHAHGVVHRDVKPGNLLLDAAGNLYVADFGIARTDTTARTRTGIVLGTAGYLSPEQARGGRTTAASDRYALAVVAGELLTGSASGRPPITLPAPLQQVFARALATAPDRRFPSCLAFVAALRAAAKPDEAPTVPLRRRRRLPAAVPIVVAAGLAVLGGGLALGLSAAGGGRPGATTAPQVFVRTVTVATEAPDRTQVPVVAESVAEDRGDDGERGGRKPDGKPAHGHGGRGHGKKQKD